MNLKEAADECKGAIRSAVEAALQRFHEQTGVTPSDIDVRMVDVTTMGAKSPKFILGDVRIGFTL